MASLGFLVASVGQQAMGAFHARLAPHGVHPRAYAVLMALAGPDTAAPTQRELSSTLRLPPSRMVGLVDELQDQDLVERTIDEIDRRAYRVRLTAAGRALVAALQAEGAELDQAIADALGPTGVKRLESLLDQVSSELEQHGTPRRRIW